MTAPFNVRALDVKEYDSPAIPWESKEPLIYQDKKQCITISERNKIPKEDFKCAIASLASLWIQQNNSLCYHLKCPSSSIIMAIEFTGHINQIPLDELRDLGSEYPIETFCSTSEMFITDQPYLCIMYATEMIGNGVKEEDLELCKRHLLYFNKAGEKGDHDCFPIFPHCRSKIINMRNGETIFETQLESSHDVRLCSTKGCTFEPEYGDHCMWCEFSKDEPDVSIHKPE